MTEARKIFYINQEIGTEVTDTELNNLSADALITAIHNSKLQPCRGGDGKLVLIDMKEDAWYFDDEYPATKIYAKEDFGNDYSLCGTVIEDDEFNSLSADELRKAVTCSHEQTYFFRNSDGDLMIQSTDESDTELTEDEIKALTADEIREVILDNSDYDVYRNTDEEVATIYLRYAYWGIEYGANGNIHWGYLDKRALRTVPAAA